MNFQEAMAELYDWQQWLESDDDKTWQQWLESDDDETVELYEFGNTSLNWLVKKADDVSEHEGIIDFRFTGKLPKQMAEQVQAFMKAKTGSFRGSYSPTAGVSISVNWGQFTYNQYRITFKYCDYRYHPEFEGIH